MANKMGSITLQPSPLGPRSKSAQTSAAQSSVPPATPTPPALQSQSIQVQHVMIPQDQLYANHPYALFQTPQNAPRMLGGSPFESSGPQSNWYGNTPTVLAPPFFPMAGPPPSLGYGLPVVTFQAPPVTHQRAVNGQTFLIPHDLALRPPPGFTSRYRSKSQTPVSPNPSHRHSLHLESNTAPGHFNGFAPPSAIERPSSRASIQSTPPMMFSPGPISPGSSIEYAPLQPPIHTSEVHSKRLSMASMHSQTSTVNSYAIPDSRRLSNVFQPQPQLHSTVPHPLSAKHQASRLGQAGRADSLESEDSIISIPSSQPPPPPGPPPSFLHRPSTTPVANSRSSAPNTGGYRPSAPSLLTVDHDANPSGNPYSWTPHQISEWLRSLGAKQDTLDYVLLTNTKMETLTETSLDTLASIYKITKLGPRLLIHDQLGQIAAAHPAPLAHLPLDSTGAYTDPRAWTCAQTCAWLRMLGVKLDTLEVVRARGDTVASLLGVSGEVLQSVYRVGKLGPRLCVLDQLQRVKAGKSVGPLGGGGVSPVEGEGIRAGGSAPFSGGDSLLDGLEGDDGLPAYSTIVRR